MTESRARATSGALEIRGSGDFLPGIDFIQRCPERRLDEDKCVASQKQVHRGLIQGGEIHDDGSRFVRVTILLATLVLPRLSDRIEQRVIVSNPPEKERGRTRSWRR
jgi:hypothetical protein